MARASMSPPGATRNGVPLACVTCYGILRFSGFLGMVQKQVTAQGWLGSTPEGRRPQIQGWRWGLVKPYSVVGETSSSRWNLSVIPPSQNIEHERVNRRGPPLLPRAELGILELFR